ncbi:TonB-dependent receptor [Parashewanella curva]|uniref:TonB-dependent receptor n=1 Tax=Parashewanella curva TaxID=2338552 RepID=A0A3L8Q1P1_9GAMM|nr:TonB-dependent receptor plug domain-containing protein [Parashewanella curva]RLV60653.1 TonB-dependent receptor [Parashewanella curva]
MLPFRLSLLAVACSSTLFFPTVQAETIDSEKADNDIERVTVYGRQNKVVMDSGLATKSNMSLMETPAAVVVVDKQLLDSQGLDDLQGALRNISGVIQSGNNYGIGDNIVVRGLGANYTYDGMYGGAGLGNSFNPTRSLTNVDAIEVLKGPATGLYGMGSAGGVINLIEKKPQFVDHKEMKLEIGQWNTKSLFLDSTGGITDEVAYRFVGKTARSDGFRGLQNDRDEVYGSIKFVPSTTQDIMLSAAYINDALAVDSIGDPIRSFNSNDLNGKKASEVTWEDLINDPSGKGTQLTEEQRKQLVASLRPNDGETPFRLGGTGLISPLSKANKGEELRFKLTHSYHFTDNLFLNQQLQYRDYKTGFTRQTGAYNYVYMKRNGIIHETERAPLVIDGKLHPFAARRQEYRRVNADEKSWQYFADLRYDFEIGEMNNEILVNTNYEDREIDLTRHSIWDQDYKNEDYTGKLPYILDIRNPNWPTKSFNDYDPLLTANYLKSVNAWGVGVQHVGYWTEQITTRIGVAFNEIEQTYKHRGVDARMRSAAPKPEADNKDNGVTYNLGITYMPFENMSIFANHAKGRTAYSVLGSIGVDDQKREDSESISNDLGFRFKGFNDQLLASLVFFKTARTNIQYGNKDYEDENATPNVPQFFYDKEEKTKGVELDVNALLNDQWKFNVNALYQDAYEATVKGDEAGKKKGVPRVTASTWITYTNTLFGLSNPLSLSAGVKYMDKRTTGSKYFGVPSGYVPAYTVVDTAASYQVQNWSFKLNLNNLFNKYYYKKALFQGGLPGEERNVKLTVSYKL